MICYQPEKITELKKAASAIFQATAALSCFLMLLFFFFCIRRCFIRESLFESDAFLFQFFLRLFSVARLINKLFSFELQNIMFTAQSFEQRYGQQNDNKREWECRNEHCHFNSAQTT